MSTSAQIYLEETVKVLNRLHNLKGFDAYRELTKIIEPFFNRRIHYLDIQAKITAQWSVQD